MILPAPPQNIEMEEAVLGGLLLDPIAYDRVAEILTPDCFYNFQHKIIWQAIKLLASNCEPIDLLTVSSQLTDSNQLETIGGTAKLVQLLGRTVSATNIDSYAKTLSEKLIRRKLLALTSTIQQFAYDEAQPIAIVLDTTQQAIYNVAASKQGDTLVQVEVVAAAEVAAIEHRRKNNIEPGLTTGLKDLDGMTGGLSPGDLIILAGRPAMGKTALGIQLCYNIAIKYQQPVLIFSLEMSAGQLTNRLLAAEARVAGDRLRAGRLAAGDWMAVESAIPKIKAAPIYIDDASSSSISTMRAAARRTVAAAGKPLGLVLVDYLQLLGGDKPENRVEELAAYTRGLKTLAREFSVPLVALSQLSRGVEARNDKRPMMSDLRSSGSIEQDADLIVMLYRESYYNKDSAPSKADPTELAIVKNRNGSVGKIDLLFDPACSKFSDAPPKLF
jgi:replicative DNA helicase